MTKVNDEKELGEAIKRGDDAIEIEFKLKDCVIKIKVIGKVSWAIAIGSIGVAVTAIILMVGTGGTTAPASALVATPALAGAVGILGVPTTISAIGIAVAGGGIGALNKLRDYEIEEISDTKAILHRKGTGWKKRK